MTDINNFDFQGKKALIRVDFNVPMDAQGHVTDDTRMQAAMPTIHKVINGGGSAILMSHMGRPKGKPSAEYSLKPIAALLEKLLGRPVQFANDSVGENAKSKAAQLQPGEVLLLENLRFHKEEEAGDPVFAEELAKLGDVYINDAYGTAHRAHASTAIVADKMAGPSMFGLLMNDEVKSVERVLKNAEHPFTAIIGGAKVSDKVGVIENLLPLADHILIGGAMAYTFIKAKGGKVGKSRVEEDKLEMARDVMAKAISHNTTIHLPADSVCTSDFKEDASSKIFDSSNIPDDKMGLDIGPAAVNEYREVIKKSMTILWNGPMGVFEWENFGNGTKSIALAVAEATDAGAYSLVGGGDSVAAVNKFGLGSRVSYISTGGGAMLESLEGKVLPGVQAITEAQPA